MVHPLALVEAGVIVPESSAVWAFAHVREGVVIGENVSIGGHAEIGRWAVIGDGSRISYGVFIPDRTRIGRHVFIGPRAVLTDDRWPVAGNNFFYKPEPPVLEDMCSIGAGAVILPGVTVGAYAMVGAGAVVTKNVSPDATVMGVPAVLRLSPHAGAQPTAAHEGSAVFSSPSRGPVSTREANLYQKVLGQPASPEEVAAWVAAITPKGGT